MHMYFQHMCLSKFLINLFTDFIECLLVGITEKENNPNIDLCSFILNKKHTQKGLSERGTFLS